MAYNTHAELDANSNQQERRPNLDATESFNNIIQSFDGNNSLTYLDLSNNGWDMVLPSDISKLSNLETLHLENNQLKHRIPSEMSQLSKLQRLYLNGNINLRGDIDAIVTGISNLEALDTSLCKELTISSQFNFPTSLASLKLRQNRFKFRTTLSLSNVGKLSNLQILDFSYMYFLQGTIPSDLISAMTNLEVLNLAGNGLIREFPWPSLIFGIGDENAGNEEPTSSSPSILRELDLRRNDLQGQLPSDIGRLTSLESLNVGYNSFIGRIPSEMSSMTSLGKNANHVYLNVPEVQCDITGEMHRRSRLFRSNHRFVCLHLWLFQNL